jgi:hypothetical protein
VISQCSSIKRLKKKIEKQKPLLDALYSLAEQVQEMKEKGENLEDDAEQGGAQGHTPTASTVGLTFAKAYPYSPDMDQHQHSTQIEDLEVRGLLICGCMRFIHPSQGAP